MIHGVLYTPGKHLLGGVDYSHVSVRGVYICDRGQAAMFEQVGPLEYRSIERVGGSIQPDFGPGCWST